MNRREAIAALVALPAATRISRAELKPSDIIVVECEGSISCETAERLKEQLTKVWPGQKILVLGDGLKLKVVEGQR